MTAVGMVVVDLTERPDLARGSVSVPRGMVPRQAVRDATPTLPLRMTLRRAARTRGGHATRLSSSRGARTTPTGADWSVSKFVTTCESSRQPSLVEIAHGDDKGADGRGARGGVGRVQRGQ